MSLCACVILRWPGSGPEEPAAARGARDRAGSHAALRGCRTAAATATAAGWGGRGGSRCRHRLPGGRPSLWTPAARDEVRGAPGEGWGRRRPRLTCGRGLGAPRPRLTAPLGEGEEGEGHGAGSRGHLWSAPPAPSPRSAPGGGRRPGGPCLPLAAAYRARWPPFAPGFLLL